MEADAKRRIAENVIEGLKKRNIEGYYCENREEAAKFILEMIGPGSTVSWGGSRTIRELGILDRLREKDVCMVEYPEQEKKTAGSPIFAQVAVADYFLMGANAITVKGELVNIDGASNRVSSLLHGPKHVIIAAGLNKLVRTVEDGIDRIQTQACPIIADATERKTPCAVKGVCTDCQTPDCMCCNIVITRRSRYTGRVKVILIGENLGV